MSRPTSAAGFTLLEILVTIVITAMVMTVLFSAHQTFITAGRSIEDGSRDRAARVVLDRIERELVGATLIVREEESDPLAHPYLFVGDDRALGESETDTLRFITQSALRPGATATAPGPQLVSYAVEQESADRLHLVRVAEPVPAQMSKQISILDAPRVAEDLATFKLRYQGEAGLLDRWDSTEVEQLDQLPLAVEVTIQLWEDGPDGEAVAGDPFTRRVSLPIRPFALAPDDPDAADGPCIEIAPCIPLILDELDLVEGPGPERWEENLLELEERCWHAPNPSQQLSSTLRALANKRVDPREVCE